MFLREERPSIGLFPVWLCRVALTSGEKVSAARARQFWPKFPLSHPGQLEGGRHPASDAVCGPLLRSLGAPDRPSLGAFVVPPPAHGRKWPLFGHNPWLRRVSWLLPMWPRDCSLAPVLCAVCGEVASLTDSILASTGVGGKARNPGNSTVAGVLLAACAVHNGCRVCDVGSCVDSDALTLRPSRGSTLRGCWSVSRRGVPTF